MLNKNFDWGKVEPHTRFTGVPDGCDSLLLAELLEPGSQTILHISSDGVRMNQVADSVGFFLPDIEVLKFPAWDCLPYDRVPPRGDVVAERMATLAALAWSAANAQELSAKSELFAIRTASSSTSLGSLPRTRNTHMIGPKISSLFRSNVYCKLALRIESDQQEPRTQPLENCSLPSAYAQGFLETGWAILAFSGTSQSTVGG